MKIIELPPVYEGGQVVLLARLEDDDATALQQADISAITIKVYDEGDPANAILTDTLSVPAVIYDTLQTGNGWTLDSAANPDPISGLYGWNFKHKTLTTYFPQGDRTYRVEAEVVGQGGTPDKDYMAWRQKTINLLRR